MINNLLTIGWQETVALPDLGIFHIKTKIDTGARTSALHVCDIQEFKENNLNMVSFQVDRHHGKFPDPIFTTAQLIGYKKVKNSGGQVEIRPVIETKVELAEKQWLIKLNLTNRDSMKFPMLIGRQAIKGIFLVDPSRSFLLSSSDFGE